MVSKVCTQMHHRVTIFINIPLASSNDQSKVGVIVFFPELIFIFYIKSNLDRTHIYGTHYKYNKSSHPLDIFTPCRPYPYQLHSCDFFADKT